MWNLYNNNQFLEPLKFSNGKTQEDVTKEILDLIKNNQKVIFVYGVCGTGKSAIALNLARNLGKSSIVVPGKNLQMQYKKDYENDKYLLKDNNEKLKISVMTGRKNHACKFLQESEIKIHVVKKEVNSKLSDIFEPDRKKNKEDSSAENKNIPCKIEIKDSNFFKIRQYLKQNKNVNIKNVLSYKDIKRIPLASVCPYWSPVLPEGYDSNKNLEDAERRNYLGLNNIKFTIYKRKRGCKFYEQFDSYIDSDVIIFNSLKYKLESALNRKPMTEVEIIDECDEFLDSFSNQRTINFDRLQNSLIHAIEFENGSEKTVKEIYETIEEIKKDRMINEAVFSKQILPLKETKVYDLMKIFVDSPEFLGEIDDEGYVSDVDKTIKMFKDFFDESYLTFHKKDKNLFAEIVTINLAKKFKDLVDRNKIIVLMSGTLHSESVLRDVFGLEKFSVVDAETKQQGKIDVLKTGLEIDCKYSNFSSGKFTREQYLKALEKSVEISVKPTLVHVNSFKDLPTENEISEFNLKNLKSSDGVKEVQDGDSNGREIEDFKKGKINVLFTTRCARGVDFPGEQCRSIVFTKYPYPNVQDSFWKILHKTRPQHYWEFYKDKARRELLQKIYRGLRFKEDHIYLLSPDSRVLEGFEG